MRRLLLEVEVSRVVWRDREHWGEWHPARRLQAYREVCYDLNTDNVYVAPRWIAWLWRILPRDVHVDLRSWRRNPAYFVANIAAAQWVIGIRMGTARRHVPALVVSVGMSIHWYLPWGTRLYLRLCGG